MAARGEDTHRVGWRCARGPALHRRVGLERRGVQRGLHGQGAVVADELRGHSWPAMMGTLSRRVERNAAAGNHAGRGVDRCSRREARKWPIRVGRNLLSC